MGMGDAETVSIESRFQMHGVVSELSPGRFISSASNTPWAAVTLHAF